MIYYSNCKINLGLQVIEKRTDGFHNISSVFYPLAWNEAIEIEKSTTTSLEDHGIKIECELKNHLCFKAWELINTDYSIGPLKIHITKTIPTGAGLGGGSANGSRMLQLLNDQFNLKLSQDKLLDYASQLGSDCPFFIHNRPMHVEGRGEKLTTIDLNLDDYYFLIVHPGIHLSTPEAYRLISPKTTKTDLTVELQNPIEDWKNTVSNDFESALGKKYPLILSIKQAMYNKNALYSSMSGSGSSIYGIFSDYQSCKNSAGEFSGYTQKMILAKNHLASFL